jgi:hypothetical protein
VICDILNSTVTVCVICDILNSTVTYRRDKVLMLLIVSKLDAAFAMFLAQLNDLVGCYYGRCECYKICSMCQVNMRSYRWDEQRGEPKTHADDMQNNADTMLTK